MRIEKTITLEDRGKKLTFKIKEMSATDLEDWSIRAVLVLAAAGSDVPIDAGFEGAIQYLSSHGFAALGAVDYKKAKPLLDEMLGCCSRVIDKTEQQVTVETANDYIEDMTTLLKLRIEAFKTNFGFFANGGQPAFPEDPSIVRLNAR